MEIAYILYFLSDVFLLSVSGIWWFTWEKRDIWEAIIIMYIKIISRTGYSDTATEGLPSWICFSLWMNFPLGILINLYTISIAYNYSYLSKR